MVGCGGRGRGETIERGKERKGEAVGTREGGATAQVRGLRWGAGAVVGAGEDGGEGEKEGEGEGEEGEVVGLGKWKRRGRRKRGWHGTSSWDGGRGRGGKVCGLAGSPMPALQSGSCSNQLIIAS